MEPLVVGSLVVLAALAAGGIGFAAAIWKASQLPDVEELQKRFASRLEEERAADRRHYAKVAEELTGLAATIKRHRAVIDGEKGGRPKEEPAPEPMSRDQQRERILAIARRRGA